MVEGLCQNTPEAVAKARRMLPIPIQGSISIEGQCACHCGETCDFTNQPTVVVAHWDPQCIVDAYVVHMCQHFKALGWKVILSSARPLQPSPELAYWKEWVDAIVFRTCAGYDFTSWKAALSCFPSLLKSSFLVLCNDSFFGPIGSFAPVHARMDALVCDFWGMSASQERVPHLQSFYMVFQKKTLQHTAFTTFFNAVPLSSNYAEANAYELSLSLWLGIHGLKAGAYQQSVQTQPSMHNLSIFFWKTLMNNGVPLIKRLLFNKRKLNGLLGDWNISLAVQGYPLSLITKYFWRIGTDISGTVHFGKRHGVFPPHTIALQQSVNIAQTTNTKSTQKQTSLPFAIIAHIVRMENFHNITHALSHLPRHTHLYINTDTKAKQAHIQNTILSLGFTQVEIHIFPRIYDNTATFWVGWQQKIQQYPLILKIHTDSLPYTNKIPTNKNSHNVWQKNTYASLLGNKERVQNILHYFINHTSLAVLAPATPLEECFDYHCDTTTLQTLLTEQNITLEEHTLIDFPVGGMFWCRPTILRPWLNKTFTFEDFTPLACTPTQQVPLAQALERLPFFACGLAHMTWGRIAPIGYDILTPPSTTGMSIRNNN